MRDPDQDALNAYAEAEERRLAPAGGRHRPEAREEDHADTEGCADEVSIEDVIATIR